MKTLIATAILAMAIASPALAQRAQSAPQQGYQSNRTATTAIEPTSGELKGRTHVRPFAFCKSLQGAGTHSACRNAALARHSSAKQAVGISPREQR
jgi:hypothetical protein